MSEIHSRDDDGVHILGTLGLGGKNSNQNLALADAAIESIFLFARDFIEPLTIEVALESVDDAGKFTWSQHLLRVHEIQAELAAGSAYGDVTTVNVAASRRLDPDLANSWLREKAAVGSSAGVDGQLEWDRLHVRVMNIMLPKKMILAQGVGLQIEHNNYHFEYPVRWRETGAWIAGPLESMPEAFPFALTVVNQYDALTIDIVVNWSLWYDREEPGRPMMDSAIERLATMGWSIGWSGDESEW
ncbi:hypothetical protein [Amycolatopsis sp. NPDC004378]